ncbi:hypothetical protein [Leifsonia sp. fls2-241-R2A-40a]|uniref:hypothetical protein n=1 Tax=Leifsonia sp. fls2-241-R2A-40a TaxID=3040290 RepID=UPI00254AC3F2|nr:hypothetical protein [Leifsonia sp. fls2-241-R2A-40a]
MASTLTTPIIGQPVRPRWFTPTRVVRLLLAAVVIAAGVAIMFYNDVIRHAEAALVALVANPFTDGGARSAGDAIFFKSADGPYDVALIITEQCSVFVMLGPFLMLLGLLLGVTRVHPVRWLTAVLVGATALVVVNEARLWFIVASTHTWGEHPGYELSHGFIGSAFGVLGFVIAMIVALVIIAPRNRVTRALTRGRRRATPVA